MPLLLCHGWPGSVMEFHKLLPMLTDPERGYGNGYQGHPVTITDDAIDHWVDVAHGDARSALHLLSLVEKAYASAKKRRVEIALQRARSGENPPCFPAADNFTVQDAIKVYNHRVTF